MEMPEEEKTKMKNPKLYLEVIEKLLEELRFLATRRVVLDFVN